MRLAGVVQVREQPGRIPPRNPLTARVSRSAEYVEALLDCPPVLCDHPLRLAGFQAPGRPLHTAIIVTSRRIGTVRDGESHGEGGRAVSEGVRHRPRRAKFSAAPVSGSRK